jgi:hypothetical protein
MYTKPYSENLNNGNHFADGEVHARVIFEIDLKEIGCECGDWIHLAHDRDRWRALVNMVTNIRAPKYSRNFLTNCRTIYLSS